MIILSFGFINSKMRIIMPVVSALGIIENEMTHMKGVLSNLACEQFSESKIVNGTQLFAIQLLCTF